MNPEVHSKLLSGCRFTTISHLGFNRINWHIMLWGCGVGDGGQRNDRIEWQILAAVIYTFKCIFKISQSRIKIHFHHMEHLMFGIHWLCLTFDSWDLAVSYRITIHLHQWAQEVSLWHHPLGWDPIDVLVATQHQDALTNHLHLFGRFGKGSAKQTSSQNLI